MSFVAGYSHADIVLLVNYLADRGADVDDLTYAVEKPWKYDDELTAAKEEQPERTA